MIFVATLALFAAGDVARAEALAVFPAVSPDNAVPGVDAVIPTNAHVFAFVSDVGPNTSALDATFDRFLSDGSSQRLDATKIEGVATAFDVDLGALTPGESVIVQANCSSCEGQFSFTVGAGDDVTAPVFDDGGAVQRFQVTPQTSNDGVFNHVTGYFLNGCLPAVHDDSPLALRITLDDGTTGLMRLTGTSSCGTQVSFSVPGGDARELCFDAAAVDVAGNETAFDGADLCVTLDPGEAGGCAQAGASSLASCLALLALVRLRSRRT